MVLATLDTKGDTLPKEQLSLSDLREVLFNGEAPEKSDLDVLEAMVIDKRGLVKKVLQNKALIERAGNPDELLHELDLLHTRYQEAIKTIEGAKNFEKKIEKQSWGKWALEKAKSVALFPVRHPVITVLIVFAAYLGLAGQIPNIFNGVAGLEGLSVENTVGKAAELIRSNLPLATGTAGAGNAVTNLPTPYSP